MLHAPVRWIARRCLRWFYRECQFVGLERIPADGPVLLIGNHPNDIPDVLCGYLTTRRRVMYVATVAGATSRISRAMYRGLGVIPVARVRDARKMRQQGLDAAATNAAAFSRIVALLRAGEIVGVFPEGGVHEGPSLGNFRAGVAKMALNCIVNGESNGLNIVVFGVQYDAARTTRSDVTITVAEPIVFDDWIAEHATVHVNVALALRQRLRTALLAVTRNSSSWAAAEGRDRLTAVIGALMSGGDASPLESAARVQAMCAVATDAAEWPDNALRPLVHEIATAVARAGGIATSSRDSARVCAAAGVQQVTSAWPSPLLLLLATPLGLLGLLVHGPILDAIWTLAKRSTKDRTEWVARAFVPGLYLMLLWYMVLGTMFAVGLHASAHSAWLAVPAVMLLPRLGDFAVSWRDAVNAERLRRRVMRWSPADRAAVCTTASALRAAWHSYQTSSVVKASV